jgi:uncharacterized protein YodC (DUF2158 family)
MANKFKKGDIVVRLVDDFCALKVGDIVRVKSPGSMGVTFVDARGKDIRGAYSVSAFRRATPEEQSKFKGVYDNYEIY